MLQQCKDSNKLKWKTNTVQAGYCNHMLMLLAALFDYISNVLLPMINE